MNLPRPPSSHLPRFHSWDTVRSGVFGKDGAGKDERFHRFLANKETVDAPRLTNLQTPGQLYPGKPVVVEEMALFIPGEDAGWAEQTSLSVVLVSMVPGADDVTFDLPVWKMSWQNDNHYMIECAFVVPPEKSCFVEWHPTLEGWPTFKTAQLMLSHRIVKAK